MIRDVIAQKIQGALETFRQRGMISVDKLPHIALEHPANQVNGDFATSLPLKLARTTRINPINIAEDLVALIPLGDELEKVWSAPPGFINFRLRDDWLVEQVDIIRSMGSSYGNLDLGCNEKVIVEFVSVNPTGPVHVGHTRGAVLGSSLAKVLTAAGYAVTTEYYINDSGTQMEAFYASVYARYKQVLGKKCEMPSNGYMGSYLIDLANEIVNLHGEQFLTLGEDEARLALGEIGLNQMIALIKDDLDQVNVGFDNWFNEKSLYNDGDYKIAMDIIKDAGYTSQREGATWFNSTSLGEEKDNVIVRSTGAPTYFAADIAYHYNKFVKRGFDMAINVWGADHQGHVPRMKAAMSAIGVEPKKLTIMIAQMVSLKRGHQLVKASKRTGEFVTLREVVDEVGADACRYFFLARTPETHMEFDLELAKRQSSDNPVYYIQYGHARITGILNNARARGINWTEGNVGLLTHPSELALIRKLLLLPELVENVARNLEPHHMPHYATDMASAFHWFYENCRVISEDSSQHATTLARLKLVEAAQAVLSKTLDLMGMGAPERM